MSRGVGKCYIKNRLKPNLTLSFFKHIFGSAAHWADPTVRKFIKGGARWDITVRIAIFRIVNITANLTFPFFHLSLSLLSALEIKAGEGHGFSAWGLRSFSTISIFRHRKAFQHNICACSPPESES